MLGRLSRPEPKRSWRGPFYVQKQARLRDLQQVTSQLAALVRMNLPLAEGLRLAAKDAPNAALAGVYWRLYADLESGESLGDAVAGLRRFFPPYYVDLVRVGEETGALPENLIRLNKYVTERMERRFRIWSHGMYVSFIFLALAAVGTFILLYVFPLLREILTDFGENGEGAYDASDPLKYFAPGWLEIAFRVLMVLVQIFVLAAIVNFFLSRGSGPIGVFGRLALITPVARKIFIRANLAHAAGALRSLLTGGVPLDVALDHAGTLRLAGPFQRMFRRIGSQVALGSTMTAAMEKERLLPASFKTLVALGEESGLLPEAFERIASQYRIETRRMERILTDVAIPLVVMVLAVGVWALTAQAFSMITGAAQILLEQM